MTSLESIIEIHDVHYVVSQNVLMATIVQYTLNIGHSVISSQNPKRSRDPRDIGQDPQDIIVVL